MNQSQEGLSNLPLNTFQDVPTPRGDAKRIVALIRENGKITGYKLSDGRTLDKEQGVQLAREGGIQGVGIATRNGSEYLKSLPDGSQENNLGSLPTAPQ